MMGGEIGVESIRGQGSLFWFTTRLAKVERLNETRPPAALTLHGRRALVASGNASLRAMLREELEARGLEIAAAREAAEVEAAVLAAKTGGRPFFAVVLDLDLDRDPAGGVDLPLTRKLRGEGGAGSPAVVLLASLRERQQGREAAAAGLARLLLKPIRREALHQALLGLLASDDGVVPPALALPAAAVSTVVSAAVSAAGRSASEVARSIQPTSAADEAKLAGRILLAEDNTVNQKLAVRLLERMGLRVDVVANGLEAVSALERIPYDLVLMDCRMPEMDGFEATAEIRRRERAKGHTPIIAVTANAMRGDRERCLEAGMDDYLSKPLSLKELRGVIERWLAPERVLGGKLTPA